MRMFILAAGKGTRLRPLTDNTPKSLIDLGNGSTMLEQQIKGAIKCKVIDEVVIITGYKSEQIEAKIMAYNHTIPIQVVYNPFYDQSNNLFSLWTAHFLMKDTDFIVTNGDNIYQDSVFDVLENEYSKGEGIKVCIDRKDEYDEDDMKVILDNDEHAVRISKEITMDDVNAESVGLSIVAGEKYRRLYENKILELVRKEEYRNKFWLEIYNSLVDDGITINTFGIAPPDWQEIDFHPDVKVLKELILKSEKR